MEHVELFEELGINVPRVVKLGLRLKEEGLYQGKIPTNVKEAEEMLKEVLAC